MSATCAAAKAAKARGTIVKVNFMVRERNDRIEQVCKTRGMDR